eukprot:scaffold686_cov342-Prasinococcus_capsulatus_cf.AAC.9
MAGARVLPWSAWLLVASLIFCGHEKGLPVPRVHTAQATATDACQVTDLALAAGVVSPPFTTEETNYVLYVGDGVSEVIIDYEVFPFAVEVHQQRNPCPPVLLGVCRGLRGAMLPQATPACTLFQMSANDAGTSFTPVVTASKQMTLVLQQATSLLQLEGFDSSQGVDAWVQALTLTVQQVRTDRKDYYQE